MSNNDLQLLAPAEVAQLLGITQKTLSQYRWRGVGPEFIKLGGSHRSASVRYRASAVRAWLEQQPTGGGRPVKESA